MRCHKGKDKILSKRNERRGDAKKSKSGKSKNLDLIVPASKISTSRKKGHNFSLNPIW